MKAWIDLFSTDYGLMSVGAVGTPEWLKTRRGPLGEFLLDHGAKALLIACNARLYGWKIWRAVWIISRKW